MPSWDKLTIETPEQTQLEFPLAGIGSRFLALAIDSLLQSSVLALLVIIATLVTAGNVTFWPTGWSWVNALIVFVVFLVIYVYYAFFEAVWNGQTPGKRYVHLRVIKDSGRPITPYEAIMRNLVRIVDQFPGIYAVGICAMLVSGQNKRLGDQAAGTLVVHEKPLRDLHLEMVIGEEGVVPPVFAVTRLSEEEWDLIEGFLWRRAQLDETVRWQMADQIADQVAETLGIGQEKRGPAEDFLAAVARERHRARPE